MPDSYGRPLWMSPRLRCEISHAAAIVRNTNETPATANPTTYSRPVKRVRAPVTCGGGGRPPLIGEDRARHARNATTRADAPRLHSSKGGTFRPITDRRGPRAR